MSLLFVNLDDPYLIDVAVQIQRTTTITTVVSTKPEEVLAALKDLDVIDSRYLYRAADVGRVLPPAAWIVPSRHQLVELLEAERDFLVITDRILHEPISVRERKRLFRNLVAAWLGWFSLHRETNAVFFESTPHMGFDVVIFHVARILGVRTLILNRTLLENRVFLTSDYRNRPGIGVSDSPRGCHSEDEMDAEWLEIVSGSNPWIEASVAKNKAALGASDSLFQRWTIRSWSIPRVAKAVLRRLEYRPRFASAFAGSGLLSPQQQWVRFRMMRRRVAALRRKYRSLAHKPDLSVPYIYFALHYQPERTSQPEALEFEDQFLAIATLSSALPLGWRIYVKEHPRQFALNPPGANRRHARTEIDYDELVTLAGVELVDDNFDGTALICSARACATLTGSTGWEALLAGKAALVFGPCWYCECEAAFLVSSVESAREAIAAVELLTPASVRIRLLRFLRALKSHVFLGTTGRVFASGTRHSYRELVEGLANGICTALSEQNAREWV